MSHGVATSRVIVWWWSGCASSSIAVRASVPDSSNVTVRLCLGLGEGGLAQEGISPESFERDGRVRMESRLRGVGPAPALHENIAPSFEGAGIWV